jgi:hypothetical protein
MMLADAERVETDPVGVFDLGDEVAQMFGRAGRGRSDARMGCEAIDAEFHASLNVAAARRFAGFEPGRRRARGTFAGRL